jgi:hypothetical protein
MEGANSSEASGITLYTEKDSMAPPPPSLDIAVAALGFHVEAATAREEDKA